MSGIGSDLHLRSSTSALEDGDMFRVAASGLSMAPFILDHDVLLVQRIDPANMKTGAVVVYLSDTGGISAHRFLGFVERQGSTALKVRGDASAGPFEFVKDSRVLGQVVAVQKGSKMRSIDNWYWRLLGLVWARTLPVGPLLLNPRKMPRSVAVGLLFLLRCSRLYRRIVGRLIGRRVRYSLASDEDLQQLHAGLSRETRDCSSKGGEARSVDSSGGETREADIVVDGRATFVAKTANRIVGCIEVAKVPEELGMQPYWMITRLWVRDRYRGAGIGRGLLIIAGATLVEHGIDHLAASVSDDNAGALTLANDVGARRPALSDLTSVPTNSHSIHDYVTVASRLREDLEALRRCGILEKYRGTGCCDAFLDSP